MTAALWIELWLYTLAAVVWLAYFILKWAKHGWPWAGQILPQQDLAKTSSAKSPPRIVLLAPLNSGQLRSHINGHERQER